MWYWDKPKWWYVKSWQIWWRYMGRLLIPGFGCEMTVVKTSKNHIQGLLKVAQSVWYENTDVYARQRVTHAWIQPWCYRIWGQLTMVSGKHWHLVPREAELDERLGGIVAFHNSLLLAQFTLAQCHLCSVSGLRHWGAEVHSREGKWDNDMLVGHLWVKGQFGMPGNWGRRLVAKDTHAELESLGRYPQVWWGSK